MNDDTDRNHEPLDSIDPTIAAALRELAPENAPPRDLFPAVRRRIERRRTVRRTLALAAAFAFCAVAGWLLRGALEVASPSIVVRSPGPANGVTPANVVGRTAYSEPDRALAEIRLQLRAEIEAKKDRLPAETRALVFENLATIDRAIAEIEQALAAEPANAALGRTYIAYREREIDLLRQANRTAARL
jgi:hypothetical protein